MIVGAYTLDLYCDCCRPYERPANKTHSSKGPHPEQYVGSSERDVMRQARREGWTFRKGKCRCRACGEEARSFSQEGHR